MVYSHIQKLSLAFHDQERTGDLISRVTSDIDAIQTFMTQGLLGILINLITLLGMIGVMFYLDWRFTLIALSVAPALFAVVYSYTRRIKKASRELRKKESELTSVVEEVLSSIRVVKAFAREDYEVRRLEEESLEGVELALRARSLKAKLTPIVDLIVAGGTCLVLWFGAKLIGKVSQSRIPVRRLSGLRLHTRTIVRDRQYAFVGSQSLRPLELNSRREIGVIFRNRTIVSSLARLFEDDWEASKPEEEAKARRIPVGKTARKMARVVSENLPVTPVVRQVVKAIQKKTALETPPAQLEKTLRAALKDVVEDTVKEAAKEAIKTMVDAPDLEDVGAK